MEDDEVCELWLGPHGELVYWIRPKDDKLFWYVGGNPVDTKRQESTAYFYFSENSQRDTTMTWLSFRDAFKDMKKVRKVMLTDVGGADPATIGFQPRTDLDLECREYFSAQSIGREAKSSISVFLPYDFRFMCKLALGVGYGLFGERLLASPYSAELRKGAWHRPEQPYPEVHGTSHLAAQNPQLNQMMGRPHAVTIALNCLRDGVSLNLNICRQLNYTIRCATPDIYDTPPRQIDEGLAMVFYPFLNRYVELRFTELIAQFTRTTHPQISDIEGRFSR